MSDDLESKKNRGATSQAPNEEKTLQPARPKLGSRPNNAPPPNSVRYYRLRAGMSQAQLGSLIGVSGETIRRIENRDTWLDEALATEIGMALDLPKEAVGFSDAPDGYTWAAKAVPLVGSVIAEDEVRYRKTRRRVAGSPSLPQDAVALVIRQGKMKGWLLFHRGVQEPMSDGVLLRQGRAEKFIACLQSGRTWWRNISIGAERDVFDLISSDYPSIRDVKIIWVTEVIGFEVPLFDLPS
ncbi:helix-turn-helix transcriptional regulator [Bradyrhizobium manausense]|nr:helix-turn-helix transcriptional regulator [Bradyrhizobium manausense]